MTTVSATSKMSVAGDARSLRVLAGLLDARRLVDAEGPECAGCLADEVRADPADVRGHLLVADPLRASGGGGKLLRGAPPVRSADDVQPHVGLLGS